MRLKLSSAPLTLIYPTYFEDDQCQSGVNHIYEGKNNCVSRQIILQVIAKSLQSKEHCKALSRNKQKYKYTNYIQVMLMRLMSNIEYLIVPKGMKFTGSGKLRLILNYQLIMFTF